MQYSSVYLANRWSTDDGIGAALLAIFGKIPWPSLVALGVFCAVFFGATAIVKQLIPADQQGNIENCGTEPNSNAGGINKKLFT